LQIPILKASELQIRWTRKSLEREKCRHSEQKKMQFSRKMLHYSKKVRIFTRFFIF